MLLSLDVISLDEGDISSIRTGIQAQTGIPADHIIVAATQTHRRLTGAPALFVNGAVGDIAPRNNSPQPTSPFIPHLRVYGTR